MPKFHPIFGHLLVLKKMAEKLPADTIMHNVMWNIQREQFPGGLFYLHLWPFSNPILVVCNTYVANQIADLNLGKPESVIGPIDTITGGPSLLTSDGAEWKRWRRLFTKGFSTSYLLGLAPAIAEEMAVFRENLIEKCRDSVNGQTEVFQMEEMTIRMTFDVIARVVLDKRLHYQIRDNELARALRSSIDWTSWRGEVFYGAKYLSIRPIVHWLNNRIMTRYIGEEIDRQFAERMRQEEKGEANHQSKSIMSLLLDDLVPEVGSVSDDRRHVKQSVKLAMSSQVRGFLFGGHDSSSGALTYCYDLLAKHKAACDRMMEEHDAVFGTNPAGVLAQIQAEPHKLNQLSYTTAFIKESLRVFPPAGAMQQGRAGAYLADETGRQFPTEGCGIWTVQHGIHYNAKHFPEPDAFLPERWLAGPDDPLYTGGPENKGAWRVFEYGPRNCIGQTLVMIELKIALAMTVREIEVVPAYEQWDEMHPRNGIKTVDGNRAYQAEKVAAHPADRFPVTLKLRECETSPKIPRV